MQHSAAAELSDDDERPAPLPVHREARRRWPLRVLFLSAIVPLLVAGSSPIAADVPSLAAALGAASSTRVAPDDLRWEPSEGALSDLVRGRKILFLGRGEGDTRDVYRARVRLSWEGTPLGIAGVYNLTATPLGDDHALVVRDGHAAFATSAFGQAQSVTLLDLAGAPADAVSQKLGDRVMRFLTNLQETGDASGIRRVDVTLDPPGRRVGLALTAASLRLDVESDRALRSAGVDLASFEPSGDASMLKVEVSSHPPKKLVHWAVDTVRAVPWIGPEPIVWLEEKAFALKDALKQTAFELGSHGETEVRADVKAALAAPVLASDGASRDDGSWPPPAIPSLWRTPEPGEGQWVAPKIGWIKRLEVPGAPSAFMRTFVRPDEQRPYTKVLLVAMDMRRLDLEMEAGSEDPKPLIGPAGPGRLPRDPAVSTRVVAAFNGAFKTEHGFHGMMVKKRVLLPPQPNVATVVLLKDGRAGFGTWGPTKEVTSLRGVPADDIVSLRQNLDPLVDRGEVNPSKRSMWGFTLPGTSMQTERSGVCVMPSGHVLYAWGDDVSGVTLAKGMKMAGCIYGMHLDMNPHHTGFLFTNIDDLRGRKYRTELLSSDMEIPNDRYIEHSAKDFFYVTVREPAPPRLEAARTGKSTDWVAASGTQPAPAWFPGLFEAEVATKEQSVTLFDVEASRASFRLSRGAAEPDVGAGTKSAATPLDANESSRVLFALGMGVAHDKRPRGLVLHGRAHAPIKAAASTALLVADASGLAIRRHEEMPALGTELDAAELPLLFLGNDVLSHSPPLPGVMRAALGVTDTGRVIVARANGGTDPALAEALRTAGCTRAVLLDRGASAQGTFDRAGAASPPRAAYDETVLYAIAAPLKPRAFRFEAETPVASGSK